MSIRQPLLICCLLGILLVINIQKVKAQQLERYQASNGLILLPGDTMSIGVGSADNGNFQYVYTGVALTILGNLVIEEGFDPFLQGSFAGEPVVIKKLRKKDDTVFAYFTLPDIGMYMVDVESAISTCELSYCRPNGYLSQQEFEKLIMINNAAIEGRITPEKRVELRNEMMGQ